MAKITVTIDKKGRATIAAEGFSGTACTRVTEALEIALGGQKTQELTPEYYEPELEQEQEVDRG